MNILYFFPEKTSVMFQWQRIHIFEELNKHGININAFNPLIYSSWDEANAKLLNVVKEGKYDLFLTGICSTHMLYINTLQEIKKLGIPTVSFRPDNLVIPFNDRELAPHFDLLWLTARDTKYLYDKWKVNTVVAPYAANPFVFQYYNIPAKRQVCFIGTPYGSRIKMMNALTKGGNDLAVFYKKRADDSAQQVKDEAKLSIYERGSFKKYKENLSYKEGRKLLYAEIKSRLFSPQLVFEKNVYLHEHPVVAVTEQSRIYSEYTLSLASTSTGFTDILKKPLPIINLRNFEIPMSGGIELCKFNSELAEYFEDGKEIVFYHGDEELVDKADFYLHKAHDSEINKMKGAARKRAEQEHTWFNRFTTVFEELGLKR